MPMRASVRPIPRLRSSKTLLERLLRFSGTETAPAFLGVSHFRTENRIPLFLKILYHRLDARRTAMAMTTLDKKPLQTARTPWPAEITAEFERERQSPN